jgi:hypothetical protein
MVKPPSALSSGKRVRGIGAHAEKEEKIACDVKFVDGHVIDPTSRNGADVAVNGGKITDISYLAALYGRSAFAHSHGTTDWCQVWKIELSPSFRPPGAPSRMVDGGKGLALVSKTWSLPTC